MMSLNPIALRTMIGISKMMYNLKTRLKHVLLGILSYLLVLGLCSPVLARSMPQWGREMFQETVEQAVTDGFDAANRYATPIDTTDGVASIAVSLPVTEPSLSTDARALSPQELNDRPSLRQSIDTQLLRAQTDLLAQDSGMPSSGMKSYIATMSPNHVFPKAPKTSARGVVGAALSGNRLVVRGSFRELSSPMRDYATDPVNPPNPNITSAFHIHRGMAKENGPFQYALSVTLDASGRGGSVQGDYTLTPEQLEALNNNLLYVDVHTTQNRGGELRAILMPVS
jgi:CHRD domain